MKLQVYQQQPGIGSVFCSLHGRMHQNYLFLSLVSRNTTSFHDIIENHVCGIQKKKSQRKVRHFSNNGKVPSFSAWIHTCDNLELVDIINLRPVPESLPTYPGIR